MRGEQPPQALPLTMPSAEWEAQQALVQDKRRMTILILVLECDLLYIS
jgi:hypothetical protein